MRDWLADVRFVLCGWRRTPGFSATIVLTLVLGLGLSSAIFAFADGYLFRPLPFPGAQQTYFVTDPNSPIGSMLRFTDTQALRRSSIADLGFVEWSASHRVSASEVLIGDRPVPFWTYEVSPGFRKTLPIPLVAGRDFTDEDHRQGDLIPTWISHRFWTRELGADPNVLGRTFRLRGPQSIVVVGILGPAVASFDLNNSPPDAVVPEVPPTVVGPNLLSYPLVRLPDGMSHEQGTAVISGVLQSVAPASDKRPRVVRLRSLTEIQLRGGKPTARVLFAGAMLVLLLAAINLVHLLLTRGVSRANEVATRAALGASNWRVTRLFLTESLLFGFVGTAGGLIMGRWLGTLIEASIPRWPTGSRNMALVPMLFDWRAVAFAVVLGVAIVLAGGLWPARRALRRSLATTGRTASGAAASIPVRLSRSILASELAVSTIVMVGTLFIGLGIWRYLHQPLGFDITDRFRVGISPADGKRTSPEELDAVLKAIRGLPGVANAAPYWTGAGGTVEVPERAIGPKSIGAAGVTSQYFETWNLRLRAGRWFTGQEFLGAEPVAVVDQKLAALGWPGADPVGREVRVGGVLRRVIGVIEPRRERLTRETPALAYVPLDRSSETWAALVWAPRASLATLEASVLPLVRGVLRAADVDIEPVTLETLFLREVGEAHFQAPIMAAFGVLAFVLAGIGVFGLVSYLVEQRTREFGIRLALGARPRDVWRSVIQQSVGPALVGLVLGIGGAWALESLVRSSVFGWESSGPSAAAVVVVALITIAVLAAMVPARRAMRIDPAVTLRME